eukprot:1144804-Pelagomonas_calceolata.AAC.2
MIRRKACGSRPTSCCSRAEGISASSCIWLGKRDDKADQAETGNEARICSCSGVRVERACRVSGGRELAKCS